MAFTLRVTIHGVALFVERPNDEVSILMCSLKGVVPRPVTYVKFDEKTLDRKHSRRELGNGRSGQLRHFELNGEQLTIVPEQVAPAHNKLEVNWREDKISKTTPTKWDEYSLKWLTHLGKLEPKHGKVNPDYFTKPGTVKPPLVARIDFNQGYLRTNGVERMQVRFKRENPKSPALLRPIARELVLELRVDGDYVVLKSEPLVGSQKKQSLDMRFKPNGSEIVDIVIGNEARADMYQETPPIVPIDILRARAAKEYVFYYRLCADPPKDPLLPFVAARPSGETFCSVSGDG